MKIRESATNKLKILHSNFKSLNPLNRKSGQPTWLVYVCLSALLTLTMVQAIHICNLPSASTSVNSQGGEASLASSTCPICLAVQSIAVALIFLIVFSPSLRGEFGVTLQSFPFVELPTSFHLSVRPPPACN
jgi:hypothetical protein